MADPRSISSSGNDSAAANVLERTKKGIETVFHRRDKSDGFRDDIGSSTPSSDVKAPNLLERVKEEIDAIVGSVHPSKDRDGQHSPDSSSKSDVQRGSSASKSKNSDKASLSGNVKEEKGSLKFKPHHHNRTSCDIDESTPMSAVKAPGIFERAKEEVEALIEAIHEKKDS